MSLDGNNTANGPTKVVDDTTANGPTKVVDDTAKATYGLLTTEAQKFIASCNMFDGDQGTVTLSENLTGQINTAVKASQALTVAGSEMSDLYELVAGYAEQMENLLKEGGKKKGKTKTKKANKGLQLPFGMKKFQDGIAKMNPEQRAIGGALLGATTLLIPGIGFFAIPLALAGGGAGFFYDKLPGAQGEDVFSQLEEGGLTQLAEQIETALNNVTTQYKSLQEARKVFEKFLQEARDKLKKVETFLITDISDEERAQLEKIQQELNEYITMLEAQLGNVGTSIEYYKTSVMQLVEDAPKALSYLGVNLLSYRIGESAGSVTQVDEGLRELGNASLVLTFQQVAKIGEKLKANVGKPFISDDTLRQIVDRQKQITGNTQVVRQLGDGTGGNGAGNTERSALLQLLQENNRNQ
ncbi:hypothetical protein HGA92_05465 [Candidatus Gracilibacteria bacterium]|nr:hypothetical protein [Candidatus Gracilibacteria bacterium]NUJ99080.1 hypothetical protein [Candidatus Gracilibacteria bacterium]